MTGNQLPIPALFGTHAPCATASYRGEVLDRLRARDEDAFEELIRRYGRQMHSVARRLMSGSDESEDAVQDALVSAFQSIDRFHGQCELSTWLYRITVNASLMACRKRKRFGWVGIDDLFSSSHHAITQTQSCPMREDDQMVGRVMMAERISQLWTCIGLLPETYRSVLILRYIDGLGIKQVANTLHISPSNAKVRLHRARMRLRLSLQRCSCEMVQSG
jgi:RNA polymerase sigma-70 factor (ECF subfamily)